jgi:hypothetical protein
MKFTAPPFVMAAVLLCLGGALFLWLESDEVQTKLGPESKNTQPVAIPTAHKKPQSPLPAVPSVTGSSAASGQKKSLMAYRLAVSQGAVTLAAAQPIQGEFHSRRGAAVWQPGQWCIRLLDENLQVLAEETARAPDALCMVLDPNLRDVQGRPTATRYAGTGQDTMMQVRFPPHPEAHWLKVYRLSSHEPADWQHEPTGSLLAAIDLTQP